MPTLKTVFGMSVGLHKKHGGIAEKKVSMNLRFPGKSAIF